MAKAAVMDETIKSISKELQNAQEHMKNGHHKWALFCIHRAQETLMQEQYEILKQMPKPEEVENGNETTR
jgi:uncharacterized membrane protein (DUF106 family)